LNDDQYLPEWIAQPYIVGRSFARLRGYKHYGLRGRPWERVTNSYRCSEMFEHFVRPRLARARGALHQALRSGKRAKQS
jgi:hypothetical protein